MTRVNVVPIEELCRLHLIAEIKEITRLCTLARDNTSKYGNASAWSKAKKPPSSYVLGTGHVNFFVSRITYIVERYSALCNEWRKRGYNVNEIPRESLVQDIDKSFLGSYTVTQEAIKLNRERIALRLSGMKGE